MTDQQPTQQLGASINNWDRFYEEHYPWLYQSALALTGGRDTADKLTQRILAKVLLSDPKAVACSNREAIGAKVKEIYPDLSSILSAGSTVTPLELMLKFYSAN